MSESPKPAQLTRREWLKVSALAGGGLALGLVLPCTARQQPWRGPDTSFSPNIWIRIHGNGRIQFTVARSEMGQGVLTALPMLLAEELEVSLGQIETRLAPANPAYVNRLIGQQITGGSTSVRDAWIRLREAGAVAREMLIAAAAITWAVPVSQCIARHAQVTHPESERRLGYGALAALAASLPQPQSVFLKEPSEWTLIGTEQPRTDTPDKVAGRTQFGLDVRLPGMLFASVERCPTFGGRAIRVDSHAAKTSPGVVDVLTISGGVAVIARDTWSALRGRQALQVTWDHSDNGHLNTELIHERISQGLSKPGALARNDGDAEEALSAATTRVQAQYEVPFQAHACMEPMNCTAHVSGGYCAIHVPTQAQGKVLETAQRITHLPAERIAVHTTFLGGGFGRRGEQDFVTDAVELSQQLKVPIQVVWTREDDIRHDFYRPMTVNQMQAGIDSDGQLVAWHHRIAGPSIMGRVRPSAIRGGIDATSVMGASNLPYSIPNLRVEYRRVDTPVPVGFWRSVGASQNTFVTECFLDELARAAGKEPLALRRLLLAHSPRHLGVLKLVAEKSGWERPLPDGKSRGIAVAESFGSYVAQVAEISIDNGQILVHRVVCAVDCGHVINPNTVRAQIQSAVVYGLTAALKGEISIRDGGVVEGNFDSYPLLRAHETPIIDVHLVPSEADPGGVGESGTPTIAPAVANAVFAATGRPMRRLPIRLPAPSPG